MSRGRILAVDDEHFFRVLYEDLLGAEGYSVTTAEDGAKALAELERALYDVVILDVIMPGENGIRVGERIKEKWPSIEVLFVTSLRDVKVATSAMQRGASDFLTKPINPDELLAVVMRLFERQAVVQEHTRLLDENIFFLDSLGVYQRGLRILEKLDPDDACEAILERLMAETSAQGGVLWLPTGAGEDRFLLRAVRGLVVTDQEPREISWTRHACAASLKTGKPFHADEREEGPAAAGGLRLRNTLYVPIIDGSGPVLLARLTDKMAGNQFGDDDLRKARLLEPLIMTALRNMRAHAELGARTPKDQETRAHDMEFFQGYLRAELQKSTRFRRKFSLLAARVANFAELRKRYQGDALKHHTDALVRAVALAIREIDVIGREQEDEFYVLLPETDYFESLSLKERIARALNEAGRRGPAPLQVALAAVTFPSNGASAKALLQALRTALLREQMTIESGLDVTSEPHWETVSTLLASKKPAFPERERRGIRPENSAIRKGHFSDAFFSRLQESLLEEIERDPGVRGVAYLGLGEPEGSADLLARSKAVAETATRIFLLGEVSGAPANDDAGEGRSITPVPLADERLRDHRFVLYLSEESAYAFYGRRDGDGLLAFHTAERGLVESLIFKLQREYSLKREM